VLLKDRSSLDIQVVGRRTEITKATIDHSDGLSLIAIGLEGMLDKVELDRLAKENFVH
jgi:hypothetical protein